jgi:NAD(P)-dependent dehydrogenase (short-subunit alcohol dehydrogenase family)
MDLHGKAALVTGGASGIGAAAARRLAAAGAQVAVVDRDGPGAEQVAAQVGGLAIAADVTDLDAVTAAVAATEERFGRLDVAFLNAGVTAGQSGIEDLDLAGYRRIMGVNVDHVVFGLTAAVPALRRAGGGHVVATSSPAGLTGMPGDAVAGILDRAEPGECWFVQPGPYGFRGVPGPKGGTPPPAVSWEAH